MRRWAFLIAVALAPLASAEARPMSAPPEESQRKPDFSTIKSRADAEGLVRDGKLVRVLLFPAELGGEDRPENIVYVPPAARDAQRLIVGTLVRFAGDGVIDNLSVDPEYRGDSFVPARILYRASSSKSGGRLEPVIEVW
jgi:hypothetical protein